ncbi:MAG: flagellar protein export ATPase FliI [Proteobacteria bacterium]|nr:flagellar protein export ATPase FliI [Pseudomonadota bacterium]MBU4471501.1 flagellar protein export ATPase FliI [Pseudomonadota bacterium]MCG2752507.1 flagellar protein export ATPase FliI [Desulfobacteraceae bacterium]
MEDSIDFKKYHLAIESSYPINTIGKVSNIIGYVIEAQGLVANLGSVCHIHINNGTDQRIKAEVSGFKGNKALLIPLEDIRGIGPGNRVSTFKDKATFSVGPELLGRIIDGLGNPIDGKGPIFAKKEYPIYSEPMNPLLRKRIKDPIDLGIKAINGLLSTGYGQRIGIFAGSGVGKSVLLGMIARNSSADVNVIGLIGERGREVNEFIEKQLGKEGLEKSVVVVATSDHLPLIRMRGAFIATTIAEYFRDQGMNVTLLMDSVTRLAQAQREIGLSIGEPPTTKGYTPSVFTILPKLLERAGTSSKDGTITGLYTVLVEGDDMNEPVADAVRSILDGHIVLTRELAMKNHYPALDILKSISRVMNDIISKEQKEMAGRIKNILAVYHKAEDLINIGAYVPQSNPEIDNAIAVIDNINNFLIQDSNEHVPFNQCIDMMRRILK